MTNNHKKDEMVRIHINQKQYESPNPTTGSALYALGNISSSKELFKVAKGNGDDQLIPSNNDIVELANGDHFYSEKEFTIIVNGRSTKVSALSLSFDEVVKLAYANPPTGTNILFTITYRNGPKSNPDGNLLEGARVHLKNGMIFNVTATDKS